MSKSERRNCSLERNVSANINRIICSRHSSFAPIDNHLAIAHDSEGVEPYIDLLIDEFCDKGIDEYGNVNSYGVYVDDLISSMLRTVDD